MAGSVNKVILVGNLGADPDIRKLPSGAKVANLRVATNDSWRDKNTGERKERTEWHRVVVYAERTAEYCEKYLRKGDKVYIEGALETRKWTDKDGKDQYTTEIAIRAYRGEVNNLSGRRAAPGEEGEERPRNAGGNGRSRAPAPAAASSDGMHDEIPF